MQLTPVEPGTVPVTSAVNGTFAQWLGTLLDSPKVIEFIGGQRWVVAKVPDAIRQGGSWLRATDGTLKAVARGPQAGQFAGIADLVGGGAALGSVVVLGPAVIGAVGVAYAHHRLESAIREVHEQITAIDLRMRDADLGVIMGARQLIGEMSEWGPPHLWPQQLRTELAVRRSALDPVCFSQRREVERHVASMVKKGEKFIGLDEDRRDALLRDTQVLCLGTMVKAQLDFLTTMILLDCDAAPFGLDRLDAISRNFADDMDALHASFQTAIDGKRPTVLNVRGFRRSRATAPTVADLMSAIVDTTASLSSSPDATLVLTTGDDGSIKLLMPSEEVDGGSQPERVEIEPTFETDPASRE
jgi:hypothetical protein